MLKAVSQAVANITLILDYTPGRDSTNAQPTYGSRVHHKFETQSAASFVEALPVVRANMHVAPC